MSAVARLLKEAESAVNEATSLDQLDVARVKYLGRKGLLTTYPVSYTHLTLPTNREV